MITKKWMIDTHQVRDFWMGFAAKQKQDDVMDVTEELKELLNAYNETHIELRQNEAGLLAAMVCDMKRFITVYDQRVVVQNKIHNLMAKLEEREQDGEDDE